MSAHLRTKTIRSSMILRSDGRGIINSAHSCPFCLVDHSLSGSDTISEDDATIPVYDNWMDAEKAGWRLSEGNQWVCPECIQELCI